MNSLPKIGTRVKYQNERDVNRACTGTVVATYPGYRERCTDPETGETWITKDHVGVRVDKPLPSWWAYIGTDRFAPSVDEISPA